MEENYISDDVMTNILKYIPLKTLLCMRTVCKKWEKIINDSNFMLEALNDNYNVKCYKSDINKAVNWLLYDKIIYDVDELHVMDNGNIFYKIEKNSYIIDDIGEILFQSDVKTEYFNGKIIKYLTNNMVHLFDQSGKLIDVTCLDKLIHVNSSPLLVSNKGNIIPEANTCAENFQYVEYDNGYVIDYKEVYCLTICTRDKHIKKIEKMYDNIFTNYGFIFGNDDLGNWSTYNYQSEKMEAISGDLVCSKNKFIIQHEKRFVLYEMKNNDYYQIYEYTSKYLHPTKNKNRWDTYYKKPVHPRDSTIASMTVDERTNYVYILYCNGDIFRINTKKKYIEFALRLEYEMVDITMMKTGKLLISYMDYDDKIFRIIDI